ncbi:hypothetical protein NFI95_15650 [Acetobacteraceae bacterium KSS8]|uniref:Uncharacterized protein n=1 Tax=Endosaccharibacter trunci TaxID=2812733 RepID=A0ABT1WAF6_9PROT|nr:hypothetical protein [Acetobacteraceae bacterium KSS8]
MTDGQYRALVAYIITWGRTLGDALDVAMRDVGITDSRDDVLDHLSKTGWDYDESNQTLTYLRRLDPATQWRRPHHWPNHWRWIDLPEDDHGDPRLLEAVHALMEVRARPPCSPDESPELPVLDTDPDAADLPRDHTEGTSDDPITLVAVVRLAKAVLAVADREEGDE